MVGGFRARAQKCAYGFHSPSMASIWLLGDSHLRGRGNVFQQQTQEEEGTDSWALVNSWCVPAAHLHIHSHSWETPLFIWQSFA